LTGTPPVKVFISYSHDGDEHCADVLSMPSHRNRFEPHPPQGWERWMRERIEWADYVLLVCTETYRRRYEDAESLGRGDGVAFEGLLLREELYEQHGRTDRIIPLILGPEHAEHRPRGLRTQTYYDLSREYDALYFRLTNQPDPGAAPAPLGEVRRRTSGLAEATARWDVLPPAATTPGAGPTDAARSALMDLLVDLFNNEELRRWLTDLSGGSGVLRTVVEGSVAPAQLSREVVVGLERAGLVDEAFWSHLQDARPGRRLDISRVRDRWP